MGAPIPSAADRQNAKLRNFTQVLLGELKRHLHMRICGLTASILHRAFIRIANACW